MISHAVFPALDPTGSRPASLCPEIIGGLLRERLAFRGLIVSDDLEMGALAGMDAAGEAAVAAVAAGCDLVLYCRDLEKALRAGEALRREARSSSAMAGRLRAAAQRAEALARRWPIASPDLESWSEARGELIADATPAGLSEDRSL
jgi:beta-N-acetylhexosaminidase